MDPAFNDEILLSQLLNLARAQPTKPMSPYFRIQPSHRLESIGLTELWQYRELIYFLAWRDIKVRYKQTVIGVAWVLLQPLAMTTVFCLIFGRMAQMFPDSVPYPLYVLVALIPWQFFSRVMSESTNSLITDHRLITRVYFPRLVVPIATALTASVDFALAMSLVALLMMWFGVLPGPSLLLLPLAILLMLAAALGVGFWLSALNVEYRDVMHAIPFLVQFWFFITPVVYATTSISTSWRWLLALNPIIAVVESFRWCLLGTVPSDMETAVVSSAMAIAFFLTGIVWFRWRERRFVDALGSGGT
jgi:lipopolysaccharide transport system permease protein